MKKLFNIILLVFSLSLFLGCEKPPVTKSGLKVKIGVIAPLSGERSVMGKGALKGIKIAREINSLLDNGDEIIFVVQDDEGKSTKAISALDHLVNKEKVSAILLLSGSDSAIAVAKVANKYKTPILATLATNPDTVKHSQYVSQLAFDDATQALVAALFVRDELFIKKVAIFNNPESVYSSYLAAEFKRQFELLGGEITDFINLQEEGPTDYEKLIAEVERKEPELLYLPVNAKATLAIANELNSYSWSPMAMVTDGMLSNVIEAHNGDLSLINGMLATDLYSNDMELSGYGEKMLEYIRNSDFDVTTHMLTGIEGYGLLINAINHCEAPYSRVCIQQEIRSPDGFMGISGNIIIDENGKADHTLFINTIEDGEMIIRVKVN